MYYPDLKYAVNGINQPLTSDNQNILGTELTATWLFEDDGSVYPVKLFGIKLMEDVSKGRLIWVDRVTLHGTTTMPDGMGEQMLIMVATEDGKANQYQYAGSVGYYNVDTVGNEKQGATIYVSSDDNKFHSSIDMPTNTDTLKMVQATSGVFIKPNLIQIYETK